MRRRSARRFAAVLSGLLAAAALGAAPALGHVDVLPAEVSAGEAQLFTIRVPSERPLDTTAVQVLFPTQITVYSVKPVAGWTTRVLLRPDKRLRGVVFRGGRIGEGEFQEFEVLGTPQEAGTAVWRARQTYSDGVVKPWTGPPEKPGEVSAESGPDEPGPGSATTVRVAGEALDTSGGTTDSGSSAGIWLGVIAIAISSGAALAVGLLWSTRPARLPEGDD